jgi:hypothetical protein
MIQTINVSDFRAAFHRMGRKDQFSYEGLGALFEYLEEFDDGGYELDVIALCCDYSEDTVSDIARNYSIDLNDADVEADDYEEQCRQIVFDYLSNKTSVIGETSNGFIYCSSF